MPGAGPAAGADAPVLGFDFGLRRIGLASGNRLTGTAAPLPAIAHGPGGPDWPALDRQVRDYRPGLLVVGDPRNVDGTPGRLHERAEAFARALGGRYGLPVERVDEHLSSREAEAELRAQRAAGERRRRVQKSDIDSLAAALILERWLGRR
jgi:putative holliday junction resolvase